MSTKIEEFAANNLGIKLFPAQFKIIEAMAEGKYVMLARSAGKSTADTVAREYLKDGLRPTVSSKPEFHCPRMNAGYDCDPKKGCNHG